MSADGLLQGGNVAVEVRAQRGDFLRPSFGEAGEGLLQLGQGRRIPTKGSLQGGELAGLVSQIHITQMAQAGQVFLGHHHPGGEGAIHHANAALDFQSAGVQSVQAQLMLLQGGMVCDGQVSSGVGTAFQRCDLLPLVRRQDFQLGNSGQHVGEFTSHVAQVQGVGVFGRPAGTGLRPVDVAGLHIDIALTYSASFGSGITVTGNPAPIRIATDTDHVQGQVEWRFSYMTHCVTPRVMFNSMAEVRNCSPPALVNSTSISAGHTGQREVSR